MANDPSTRDRVRALVRDVLKKAAPDDTAPAETVLPSRFIDVAPQETVPAAPEFDRDESAKTVVTEDDLRGLSDGARVRVAEAARLTPSAADFVREHSLVLVRRAERRGVKIRRVAVGADHGGYPMKEELKKFLAAQGQRVLDFGTNSTDAVDYPDFAQAVAQAVAQGRADVGIIIDGAGIGSAMAANKVPGARAAACYTVALAKNSREHNGANVLTLGSGTISGKEMQDIVAAWLGTDLTEPRHRKRVDKIMAIERQYKR